MPFPEDRAFNEALVRIVSRALTNAAYRDLCFQDAAAAFLEVAGFALPAGLALRFKEGEGLELGVGLSAFRPVATALADLDLEPVAGGRGTQFFNGRNVCE